MSEECEICATKEHLTSRGQSICCGCEHEIFYADRDYELMTVLYGGDSEASFILAANYHYNMAKANSSSLRTREWTLSSKIRQKTEEYRRRKEALLAERDKLENLRESIADLRAEHRELRDEIKEIEDIDDKFEEI